MDDIGARNRLQEKGGLLLCQAEIILCNTHSPRVLANSVYVAKEQVSLILAIVYKGETIQEKQSLM